MAQYIIFRAIQINLNIGVLMSKEVKKEVVKEKSNKEVIENLQVQLKDYREKAEYFRTMSIKAEGAIEVLSQLEKDKDGEC